MHMSKNEKIDYAIKRICFDWPANPYWIYTSPDRGKTVYRAMRTDVCPDIFKDSYGQPIKQLYTIDGKVVSKDSDYGKEEIKKWQKQ